MNWSTVSMDAVQPKEFTCCTAMNSGHCVRQPDGMSTPYEPPIKHHIKQAPTMGIPSRNLATIFFFHLLIVHSMIRNYTHYSTLLNSGHCKSDGQVYMYYIPQYMVHGCTLLHVIQQAPDLHLNKLVGAGSLYFLENKTFGPNPPLLSGELVHLGGLKKFSLKLNAVSNLNNFSLLFNYCHSNTQQEFTQTLNTVHQLAAGMALVHKYCCSVQQYSCKFIVNFSSSLLYCYVPRQQRCPSPRPENREKVRDVLYRHVRLY